MIETAQTTGSVATKRLGMWLFFLSESFLFIALLGARYYILGLYRPPDLNQFLGLVISIVLILSSLTAYRGELAISRGQEGSFRRNVTYTICLGALFLVGVGVEWAEGFRLFPPNTEFGTIFFTLTGFHAFHVLTGLAALGTLLLKSRRGRYTPQDYWGAEAIIKYWHFVDVAWVFLFPTLYLVS